MRPEDLPPPESGFVLAPERREVGPGARAVLEDAGLARPQVHDAAVIDQIVVHGLDEAGVGLRSLVGARGAGQGSRGGIDEVVALRRPGEAVGVVKARVEPLRRIGRRDLRGQHVAELVVEGAGVRRRSRSSRSARPSGSSSRPADGRPAGRPARPRAQAVRPCPGQACCRGRPAAPPICGNISGPGCPPRPRTIRPARRCLPGGRPWSHPDSVSPSSSGRIRCRCRDSGLPR